MMKKFKLIVLMVINQMIIMSGYAAEPVQQPVRTKADSAITVATDTLQVVNLPKPYATKSVDRHSKAIGWPADKAPVAPSGFAVTKFAEKLRNPRWIYVEPNGDVFVAEASTRSGSANNILLFRDNNNDGRPELKTIFLTGLNRPFGILILGNKFYVANTNGIVVYPYRLGQLRIADKGKKILELPAGGYNNHWTRTLLPPGMVKRFW
jgi:glucose/arabinose dehydrogenase